MQKIILNITLCFLINGVHIHAMIPHGIAGNNWFFRPSQSSATAYELAIEYNKRLDAQDDFFCFAFTNLKALYACVSYQQACKFVIKIKSERIFLNKVKKALEPLTCCKF